MLMCYEQCGRPFYLRLAKQKTQGEGTFHSTASSFFFLSPYPRGTPNQRLSRNSLLNFLLSRGEQLVLTY